jgi:CspA family cold shock protein
MGEHHEFMDDYDPDLENWLAATDRSVLTSIESGLDLNRGLAQITGRQCTPADPPPAAAADPLPEPTPVRRAAARSPQGGRWIRGTVKWFNAEKGYGFIAVDGGADIFLHATSIEGDLGELEEGQRIEFLLHGDTSSRETPALVIKVDGSPGR